MKQQKVKSNASWNGLSVKQRKTLESWLFEENLGYTKTLKRAREELGYQGSMTSLCRYFKHAAEQRTLAEFTNAAALAEAVDGAALSTERLQASGMKVAARVFFKMVTETPQLTKEWAPLAKLLLQSEENQIRRDTKEEENQLRRETLEFSRVRFQYNAVGSAMRMLPKLNELAEADREANMTQFDRNKQLNDVRRGLFGDAIPELLPENEEEAAHPEIIQRRYEEAQRRRSEEHERERVQIERRNEELARKYRQKQRAEAAARAKAAEPDLFDADENGPEFRELPRQEDPEEARRKSEERRLEFERYRQKDAEVDKIIEAERLAALAEEEKEEAMLAAQQEAASQPEAEPPSLPGADATGAEKQETTEAPSSQPEAPAEWSDEPKKLTKEERERENAELMKRARMQAEWERRRGR